MSEVSKTNGQSEAPLSQESVMSEIRSLEATLQQIRGLQDAVLLDRMTFARQNGQSFAGLRDEYELFGYDRIITAKQYRDEYARGGISGRIVDVFPNATWRNGFELIEDADIENYTPWEQAWVDLEQRLQITEKFHRVDKLAGLATYAVLLLGSKKGGGLETELPQGSGPDDLIYLTPFSGGGDSTRVSSSTRNDATSALDVDCTIEEYEKEITSPRFGQPKTYRLKRTDVDSPALAHPVHWSRIVHVAENILFDEVFGQPSLERTWNLGVDLHKVTGGGAEAYWLRANQGMHLDIDKDMDLEKTKNTLAALKAQADNYKHQLDRWIRTRGVKVTPLGSDVANFENPADAILTQISGAKAIPKRILTGSEMGELASSQDRENWRDQVVGRQKQHAGPNIVRKTVGRLIDYGYLPEPKNGALKYEVRFSQMDIQTAQEKSSGAKSWADTQVNAQPVFTEAEIRDRWYGMGPLTDEQKQEIQDQKQANVEMQQKAVGPGGGPAPTKPQFPRAAEQFSQEEDEMVEVLRTAIECNNTSVIDRILGVERA